MNPLRRLGVAIATRARWWTGSENRAAAALVGAGFVLVALALAVSTYIADGVASASTQSFDEEALRALHAAKDRVFGAMRPSADAFMNDITALGGVTVLTTVTIFAAVYLALAGRKQEAALTIVVALGVFLLNLFLKSLFGRPRPNIFERPDIGSTSFPSGHAMASMACYVTYGVLLARLAPTWTARAFATTSAVFVALVIAFSRVWLGVHYPTDVAAGALLGLAWALTVLCADEVFRRERALRAAPSPSPSPEAATAP